MTGTHIPPASHDTTELQVMFDRGHCPNGARRRTDFMPLLPPDRVSRLKRMDQTGSIPFAIASTGKRAGRGFSSLTFIAR